MNFLTGKHLDRRTLLRGAGAAIALPALDAMLPALPRPRNRRSRVAVVYVPNGIVMKDWKPADDRPRLHVHPHSEAARTVPPGHHCALGTGQPCRRTRPRAAGTPKRPAASFPAPSRNIRRAPMCTPASPSTRSRRRHWAAETRVPSLQIGCEDARMVGNCDTGSSCAYTNTLSWRNADTPLPVEVNPRSVFERLFGTVDPSLARRRPRAPRPLSQEHPRPYAREHAAPDERSWARPTGARSRISDRHSRSRDADCSGRERSGDAAVG